MEIDEEEAKRRRGNGKVQEYECKLDRRIAKVFRLISLLGVA